MKLLLSAAGFNGVAGFRSSEAAAALAPESEFTVEEAGDGGLVWKTSDAASWETGETIAFFWQTTQNPSGPVGIYRLVGDNQKGTANGPLPTPVVVVDPPPGIEVPEPGAIAPLALLGTALLLKRRSSGSATA